MRYDTTLKDLFQEPPQHLLRLLVGKRGLALLPMEFPATMRRVPDLVLAMEDHSILHVDMQSTAEPMEWRMLMYYALIRQRYPKQALVQKVLYLGMEPWRFPVAIEEPALRFSCEVVDIRDIDCRRMLESPSLEENILAVLCRMEDGRDTIREVLRRISHLKPKARADALTKLVVLSGLRRLETTVQEEADRMAITVDVMENAVLRGLFLKTQQESEAKGRQEGGAYLLLYQIERRFGSPPEWVKAKLAAADLEMLKAWSQRVWDVASLEELFG
ncbi:MAG: hypothetical protein HQL66_12870 [Magnetococcales bacterium]|nr:hypothetical protein [Magnetococcales bacterium]